LRAILEAVTTEIGDMFNVMDFNISQSVLSTAQGRALDLIGGLYGTARREISGAGGIESTVGAFMFYINSPHGSNITIPKGTRVLTGSSDLLSETFTYETTQDATILAGQLYAYAGIKPKFSDSVFTAGSGSLTVHDYIPGGGVTLLCRNIKPIPPQIGYELDSDYRTRIIKSIRVTASGTAEAVRFKALSFEGVRDARIEQQPYGMGSFRLLITPEVPTAGGGLVRRITPEIKEVAPIGSVMYIQLPESLPFDVSVNLTISNKVTQQNKERIRARTKTIIQRYLNNLLPGAPIVYNRLVSSIFTASSEILDVQITSFSANGTEVGRRNYTPMNNQQIVPAGISITTSV
jgi:uncharacterized phage protein gp47/JayE